MPNREIIASSVMKEVAMQPPQRCFSCSTAIADNNAVLLSCECNIAFCTVCAFQQLAKNEQTYHVTSSYCPLCYEEFPLIIQKPQTEFRYMKNLENAEEHENYLLRNSFIYFKLYDLSDFLTPANAIIFRTS